MTPQHAMSALFAKKDSVVDYQKILEYYAQWDQGEFDFFDEYLDSRDEVRLGYLWRFMESSGFSIRPLGHEFYQYKEETK